VFCDWAAEVGRAAAAVAPTVGPAEVCVALAAPVVVVAPAAGVVAPAGVAAVDGGVATVTLLGPPLVFDCGPWAEGPQAVATSARPAKIDRRGILIGGRLPEHPFG
jgi:hypothetical protein